MMKRLGRIRAFCRRLRRDQGGLALLEFAFAGPIVLSIGLYGVETASLALANMRVSQAALNIADNSSRLGSTSPLNTQQLRESDINDIIAQIRQQTNAWQLTTRGRVIISSLEESGGKQMVHWQRCVGLRKGAGYDSSFPPDASPTDGSDASPANGGVETTANLGLGPNGSKVVAPPNSGVMFVEVNFEYKPVVSELWLPAGTTRLHYIASFIVRDRRDFSQIFPSASVPASDRMTCNRYTT